MVAAVIIVSLFLFLVYALLIFYYRSGWKSIPEYNHSIANTDPGISIINCTFSIIIPARNEAENIKACLDSICDQSYPKELYEVIVVDDHSTDDTAMIVKNYASQKVKLISLKDTTKGESINSYKKKAIETAIAQSSGDIILTTDADCIVPVNWLQTIASFYEKTGAVFIAMPVMYSCKNNFLEIFQALDFMTLQGITGASVHKKIHSMCNGANLAYTKKAFHEAGGFKGIDTIASGDDMLLMHKIYKLNPYKVFFLKSKEVIVLTQPMKTIKDFFNQRIRWASKADKYDDKRIFAVLLMVYLFNTIMVLLPLISVFKNPPCSLFSIHFSLFTFWLLLLVLKTIVELLFLYPVAKFFSRQQLLFYFPVAQVFHIIYTVTAGWLGKFGNYQWKGRSVK